MDDEDQSQQEKFLSWKWHFQTCKERLNIFILVCFWAESCPPQLVFAIYMATVTPPPRLCDNAKVRVLYASNYNASEVWEWRRKCKSYRRDVSNKQNIQWWPSQLRKESILNCLLIGDRALYTKSRKLFDLIEEGKQKHAGKIIAGMRTLFGMTYITGRETN